MKRANLSIAETGANQSLRTPHSAPRTVPELLAPAGDWECVKAAVENGADAIYFGLDRFNARMRAHNFTEADLPKLMEFLHRRGVKGYVTFNTLVFANELAQAEEYLRAIIAAGVDAAIVQDIGICRLIRKLSLDFPIHASTQMTITSAGGVEFAKELGCNLVVLARECSLKEIEKIQAAPTKSPMSNVQESKVSGVETSTNVSLSGTTDHASRITHHSPLPLEVFVHGALCVAYSGQCLTSEALGGRSANRGECAQACRMPYELVSDGQTVPLGDRRYLLSPQDLAGLEVLPELIRSGVSSLKIEGRLKSPEYVANITRVYRSALDQFAAHELESSRERGPLSEAQADSALIHPIASSSRYDLEMAFSRGLYTGWFRGINNQELAHARFGKKRGVYLGEVSRIQGEAIAVKLQAPLKLGDGVVLDAGHPDQKEEGGRVYALQNHGAETLIEFGSGDLDFNRIQAGDKLWKTSDPELDRRIRQTFSGEQPHFQRPLKIQVHGHVGASMTVVARDDLGHVVQSISALPLAKAENQPLTSERLRSQFGRLGGTPFRLGELENHLEGEVILPMKEMNRLRREFVAELEALRAKPRKWTLELAQSDEGYLTMSPPVGRVSPLRAAGPLSSPGAHGVTRPTNVPGTRPISGSSEANAKIQPHLIVLVRSLAQLEAVLGCGVQTVYCEFEDPKKYREAVTRFREWQKHPAPAQPVTEPASSHSALGTRYSEIFVAPPRIFKMGEEWILKQVRSADADGCLVRSYDHLKFFADVRRVGDFSLNVANALTAEYFKNRFSLERVTVSYDLNFAQLEALLQSAPPEWFEITIHQHMPMFHMEHCVFCAFLSKGTDHTNCGRPCDEHQVKLRDRVGQEHPLKADIGCRNTVFNSAAQTGAEYVERFLAAGARAFRIEFLNETPGQVAQTIAQYRKLLRGEITGTQLWRELRLVNQLGVTRGQMEKA